ncbi:MAG TPA: FG-GAP-like repeat-containing protein, partial [Candidatus Hydrogenedentes bacterium]|nr:FG-GAP-like repeat-containing protein [Candidatus Hydrogenedentota bacterium]
MVRHVLLLGALLCGVCGAGVGEAPILVKPGAPPPADVSKAASLSFSHEIWGQTHKGEGYVYGPWSRTVGLTAVDIDLDGDTDFVFPNTIGNPQLMRNLGSANTFYPGGSKDLTFTGFPTNSVWGYGYDFEDVNGDKRPDMVAEIYRQTPSRRTLAAWFRNNGPDSNPTFSYQGILYTSPQQDRVAPIWVKFADINGNGLQDLFVCEGFIDEPSRHHRVFFLRNQGAPTAPSWANPVEIVELGNLLPDRIPRSALKAAEESAPSLPEYERPLTGFEKVDYTYALGDFELADWDFDDALDVMFYDRREGLKWIPNVGTETNPVWSSTLGNDGRSLYDHSVVDNISSSESSFAMRRNPKWASPGEEWSDDVFLSVNNLLKTYRYFYFFMGGTGYRIVQTRPLAYPAGQGISSFWDYDGDGDHDMFRIGINSSSPNASMLLFPNIGMPYAPIWGEYQVISGLSMGQGGPDNNGRQDNFTFVDYDADGSMELLVQGQDGRVRLYAANPPAVAGGLPTFELLDDNFGRILEPGDADILPMGIAAADFDQFADGMAEVFVCYYAQTGDEGGAKHVAGNFVMYDTYFDMTFEISGQLPDPAGGPLDVDLIENLAVCDLNRDGRPDLVVTIANSFSYNTTAHYYYRNEWSPEWPYMDFVYGGTLNVIQETDGAYARMPAFVDIDADGDDDLFVGHHHHTRPNSAMEHYQRFYRNSGDTGLNYWRRRAVAGQLWTLTWGGLYPDYSFMLNGSGGSIPGAGQYRAGLNAPCVDIIQSTNLGEDVRIFIDVFPPLTATQAKAIIVVGGEPGDGLYTTFRNLAGYAYHVLWAEGFTPASIRFFANGAYDATGDGTSDVYAAPTLANLQQSISQWARDTQKLLVYFIDHGQRDRFRVNTTEYLEAATLNSWLDTLQTGGQGPQVTVVIDTCEAASMLDDIKGPRRIGVASSGTGPLEGVALFDKSRYISFSLNFWVSIFNGSTYGEAFRRAKSAIEAINPLQRPVIDDNGNGIGNEADDGFVADGVRPGSDFEMRGPGVFIGDIAPPQTASTNSATIWLADVASNFPVDEAGALIVPPNFQRPSSDSGDEQPVTGLAWAELTYNASMDRWQASYSGFNEGGLYQVQYFVKAGGLWYASPRIGFVDRINLADAWEAD